MFYYTVGKTLSFTRRQQSVSARVNRPVLTLPLSSLVPFEMSVLEKALERWRLSFQRGSQGRCQRRKRESWLNVTSTLSHHTWHVLEWTGDTAGAELPTRALQPWALCAWSLSHAEWKLSCIESIMRCSKKPLIPRKKKKKRKERSGIKKNLSSVFGSVIAVLSWRDSWKPFRCWWQKLFCDVPESSCHKKCYIRFRNPTAFLFDDVLIFLQTIMAFHFSPLLFSPY